MNKRITLADIAAEAGVHKTTVSMALRNHPNLPRQTIERIQQIAERMGYRPDPALSALNAYRHDRRSASSGGTLAYLTNWNSRFGWKEHSAHQLFFEGATQAAFRLGYSMDHFWLSDPELTQTRLNHILLSRGIQGLLLASWLPQHDLELDLEWDHFTGIKIDYFPSAVSLHSVTNDQLTLMQLAFQSLLDRGYQRIGLVMPDLWDSYVKNAWSIGYLAAQQTVEPETRVPMLRYGASTVYGVADANLRVSAEKLQEWMVANRPDVILSYEPYVREAFAELGLTPGQNLSYADLFVERGNAGFAGVVNRCEDVGRTAVELLVGQIQRNAMGHVEYENRILVQGYWMDGPSLVPLPGVRAEST